MVTPKESPSLAKYYNKTDSKTPIIIDENNTLKTILEANRVPSIYIFKDGNLITSRKWPMEEDKKTLSKLFDDISKDNLLPHIKKEYIYSGKFFQT